MDDQKTKMKKVPKPSKKAEEKQNRAVETKPVASPVKSKPGNPPTAPKPSTLPLTSSSPARKLSATMTSSSATATLGTDTLGRNGRKKKAAPQPPATASGGEAQDQESRFSKKY
jgi:hypothetical protein